MTLTLPDAPALQAMPEDELRLDLACVMYARGQVGKIEGAKLAGVDFFTFQQRLGEMGLGGYTREMVCEDLAAIRGRRSIALDDYQGSCRKVADL